MVISFACKNLIFSTFSFLELPSSHLFIKTLFFAGARRSIAKKPEKQRMTAASTLAS